MGRKIGWLEKLKQIFVKFLIAKDLGAFDLGVGLQILEPQGVAGKFLGYKDLCFSPLHVADAVVIAAFWTVLNITTPILSSRAGFLILRGRLSALEREG
ncbi:MAG TPA: hypothetical protein VIH89_15215 [Candidatus Sulfotelmatobacter sp.]